MKQMVLVDWMNFVFTNLHAGRAVLLKDREIKELNEDDIPFLYHMVMKNLLNLIKTHGKISICREGKNSLYWRRSIFSGYKENRKNLKETDDYKMYINILTPLEKILEVLPVKVYKVDNVEADDIIHSLVKKYHKEYESILIYSSDKDLVQLKNYYGDHIDVYSIARKKFIEKDELIIQRKAVVGDSSDGIPGIPRIGDKTFEKIINDPNEWNKKIKNGNSEIYRKFLKIIDLRELPFEYQNNILTEDEKIEYNSFDEDEVEMFLFNNNLNNLLNEWNIIKNEIRSRI